MKKIFFLLTIIFVITGCANSAANLSIITAKQLKIHPKEVAVQNIYRKPITHIADPSAVTWQARTPEGIYDCTSDANVTNVYCAKAQ